MAIAENGRSQDIAWVKTLKKGRRIARAVMATMAYLEGDKVIVKDQSEASRIYNKGCHGIPSKDGLTLSLLEALYLVEAGRIELVCGGACGFEATTLEGLMTLAIRSEERFELRYTVYRDLRERGFVVRPSATDDHDLDLYERGTGPGKGAPFVRVTCISEREPFDGPKLWEVASGVQKGDKRNMLAIMDEEGDVTYYDMVAVAPSGRDKHAPPSGLEAVMFEDKVMVMGDMAEALSGKGNYGKMVGKNLQISLLETAYLMEEGQLSLHNARTGKAINRNTFMKRAIGSQPDLPQRLRIYRDLRKRKMVVKTGFKYGTHFRVYEGDPDKGHARYLVHVVPSDFKSTWPEVSRAVRLAHGVRKDLVLARDMGTGKGPAYLLLERARP